MAKANTGDNNPSPEERLRSADAMLMQVQNAVDASPTLCAALQ
jgi:hypothetical protein